MNRWVASEEVQTALKEANSKAAEGLTLTEEMLFGGQVGVYADEEANRYFIANGEKYPADTSPADLVIRNYDTLRKVTITNQTQMDPWLSSYGEFEEDMKQSEAKPYLDRVTGESPDYFSQSSFVAVNGLVDSDVQTTWNVIPALPHKDGTLLELSGILGILNTYDVLDFNLTSTEDGYTYDITRHYGDGSSQKIVVNAVSYQAGDGGQIEVLCDGEKKEQVGTVGTESGVYVAPDFLRYVLQIDTDYYPDSELVVFVSHSMDFFSQETSCVDERASVIFVDDTDNTVTPVQVNWEISDTEEYFYGDDYRKGEWSEEKIQEYYNYHYNEGLKDGFSEAEAKKYAKLVTDDYCATSKEHAETLASQQAIQEQKEAEREAERQQIEDDWNAKYGIGGLTLEEYSF